MSTVGVRLREWRYNEFQQEITRCMVRGAEIIRLSVGAGKLNVPGLERLLADEGLATIYQKPRLARDVHLVLDLRGCVFLDPYGLTAVRALCEAVASKVRRIWLCLPENPDARSYFGVAGLTDGVRSLVTIVDERDGTLRPSTTSEVLLPLTTISGDADVAVAAASTQSRLDGMLDRLGWPRLVAERTRSAILEVAMNVVEHAEASGHLAVQGYSLDQPHGFLVIAISDAGVGIRHTLARAFGDLAGEHVPEGEVLARLFREHLSSRAGRSGGRGMQVLQDAIRTVGGSLDVRSGRGAYYQRGWTVRQRTGLFIPGTHVRLALNRPG